MHFYRLAFVLIILSVTFGSTHAQSLKLAAGNTLIGTANGAIIGLSVMGLNDNTDWTPIRFGVGAGTLYGLGAGIYDVSQSDGFGFYSVDGVFNSTEYSSLIALLDTFYGSVTGTVLGLAIALMADDDIVKFMQYGASAGAIGGFAFGLVDAFYLSSSSSTYVDRYDFNDVGGLLQVVPTAGMREFKLGLIQPTIYQIKVPGSERFISSNRQFSPGLQVAHLKIPF